EPARARPQGPVGLTPGRLLRVPRVRRLVGRGDGGPPGVGDVAVAARVPSGGCAAGLPRPADPRSGSSFSARTAMKPITATGTPTRNTASIALVNASWTIPCTGSGSFWISSGDPRPPDLPDGSGMPAARKPAVI